MFLQQINFLIVLFSLFDAFWRKYFIKISIYVYAVPTRHDIE